MIFNHIVRLRNGLSGNFFRKFVTDPKIMIKYVDTVIVPGAATKLSFVKLQEIGSVKEKLSSCLSDLDDLEELKNDAELAKLAAEDRSALQEEITQLTHTLEELILPQEAHSQEDAMIEVVPGAGGLEASLFAEEIFNMYIRYAEYLGHDTEIEELTHSPAGSLPKNVSSPGITKGRAKVVGHAVFGQFKFESGVHRVQRVPVTGTKSDRMQTSTCSVAILPCPTDIQITLHDSQIKLEYMRASGAGGQGVNTTDSACRVTHLPTGLQVECQEERSQHQNKTRAINKLKNILFEMDYLANQENLSKSRKSQIGNMNRNEKIRTYHYQRHMITDHRLGETRTVPNMAAFTRGELGFQILDSFSQSLQKIDREEQLQQLLGSLDS